MKVLVALKFLLSAHGLGVNSKLSVLIASKTDASCKRLSMCMLDDVDDEKQQIH